MPDVLTFLGSHWYYVASAVGMVVLLVLYGAAYNRALQPRAGTLEWISLYDRPSFSLVGRWTGLDRRDAVPLLAVCAAAVAAWGFAAWRSLSAAYGGVPLDMETAVEAGFRYGLVPVLTAICMYLLGKGLTGSTLTALLSALVLSLDLTAEPLLLLLAAGQALLLTRYLTAGEERGYGEVCLWLILAFALNAVACYVYAGFTFVTAAMVVLLIAGAAGRFVLLGRGWLLRSLVTAVLTWCVVTLLVYVPGAAAAGIAFPAGFLSENFYLFAALRILTGLQVAFGAMPFYVTPLFYDWPLLLFGLGSLVALIVGMIRRRDTTGLVGVVWLAALTAAWLVTGLYAVPVGCMLCIGAVWGGFCRRGRTFPVLLGSACVLALLLGLYILSWLVR